MAEISEPKQAQKEEPLDVIQVDPESRIDTMTGDTSIVEKIALDTINAETEYTLQEFRRLRWKIDLWLLPLMWVSACVDTFPVLSLAWFLTLTL